MLKLNPVTALLSRKHMDTNLDRALKRTMLVMRPPTQSEVPLSLLPDVTPTITEALGQHGAILQLPPRPSFLDIAVTTNTILLRWEFPQECSDVTADRTLTFSLHCHADVPLKLKSMISFKKQLIGNAKQITPESGFEDFSGSSAEPFPSVPQSLLGSRNISLIGLGRTDNNDAVGKTRDEVRNGNKMGVESLSHVDIEGGSSRSKIDDQGRDQGEGTLRLLPEPVRQPQPKPLTTTKDTNCKLPEVVHPGVGPRAKSSLLPSVLPSSASAARLNLPPLRQTHETLVEAEADQLSDSTTVSGTLADSDDHQPPSPSDSTHRKRKPRTEARGRYSSDNSTSSLSESSSGAHNSTFTNVGRFCRGFAFDEIYNGEEPSFLYSGLLPGATYYFRVHCHNAAGWGPWSDTVKCTTVQGEDSSCQHPPTMHEQCRSVPTISLPHVIHKA